MDPLAELFVSTGSYAYSFNNPIRYEDKDGAIPWVKVGLVFKAEDYPYSSAADYAGGKGMLDDVIVVK